jgi:glutamate racemase
LYDYPFIKELIQNHLGHHIHLIDTGQAVVNHLSNFLSTKALSKVAVQPQGSVLWLCNVDLRAFNSKPKSF